MYLNVKNPENEVWAEGLWGLGFKGIRDPGFRVLGFRVCGSEVWAGFEVLRCGVLRFTGLRIWD